MTLYPAGTSVARESRRRGLRRAGQPDRPADGRRLHVPRRRSRLRPRAAARAEVVGLGSAAGRGRHPASGVRAQGHARRVRQLPGRGARPADAVVDRHERAPPDAVAGHPLRRRRSAGRTPDAAHAPLAAADHDARSHARRRSRDVPLAADEVQSGGAVPLLEAEAVVRSLSVAMHGDRRMVLPLLQLKEFDQYTTTHSLNVAVLAMGLAESLGCRPQEIRAIRRRRPAARHRQDSHPDRGADQAGQAHRRRARDHEPASHRRRAHHHAERRGPRISAATVAYEHHIMLNGGGYPVAALSAASARMASRLVHVCDVYDALSTKRPYRDAWPHTRRSPTSTSGRAWSSIRRSSTRSCA